MKRIIGSLLAVVAAGSLVAASSARNSGEHSTLRSGTLHVKKECSQYTGKAGSFCTVYSSNLKVIAVGSKIVYATPDPGSDSDLTLYSKGAKAFGHVIIDLNTGIGTVTFSGGTGPLRRFNANLVVKPIGDPAKTLYWRWDGKYSY
jgi:hypothetical protein